MHIKITVCQYLCCIYPSVYAARKYFNIMIIRKYNNHYIDNVRVSQCILALVFSRHQFISVHQPWLLPNPGRQWISRLPISPALNRGICATYRLCITYCLFIYLFIYFIFFLFYYYYFFFHSVYFYYFFPSLESTQWRIVGSFFKGSIIFGICTIFLRRLDHRITAICLFQESSNYT